MDHGGECLIGAFVMVAEGLAIDRDARDRIGWRALEYVGQAIGVGGERAEGDVVRQAAVVHEDRDRPAAAQLDARRQAVRRRLGDLMRREHRELDSRGGEDVECLAIDRGLRQPESDGISPKQALEVRNARERQDDVVVRHRQRVAMVGANHPRVGLGSFALHPVEQRRSEIEAQELIDRDERLVRLPRDADVPVVIGRRRWLDIDLTGPGVFAGRLVEVSVNDNASVHLMTSAMLRRTFGKTLSCAPSASTRCIVASSILPLASARTRSSACPQCSSNR